MHDKLLGSMYFIIMVQEVQSVISVTWGWNIRFPFVGNWARQHLYYMLTRMYVNKQTTYLWFIHLFTYHIE